MKPTLATLLMSLSLTLGLPAWGDSQQSGHVKPAGPTTALSEGVVKKVDTAQGKLTIRHGPLENLGMPGMTMVFASRMRSCSIRSKQATTSASVPSR